MPWLYVHCFVYSETKPIQLQVFPDIISVNIRSNYACGSIMKERNEAINDRNQLAMEPVAAQRRTAFLPKTSHRPIRVDRRQVPQHFSNSVVPEDRVPSLNTHSYNIKGLIGLRVWHIGIAVKCRSLPLNSTVPAVLLDVNTGVPSVDPARIASLVLLLGF